MKRFILKEKLSKEILTDIKYLLKNQIEKNCSYLNAETIKLLKSEYLGEYIQAIDNQHKERILFNYFEKENTILISEDFNEFRVFDLLEDSFNKIVVIE